MIRPAARDVLTPAEVSALVQAFPELDWICPADWQAVAGFADWQTWVDDVWFADGCPDGGSHLVRMLGDRRHRVSIRLNCRAYFGPDNVPNVLDPDDPTWA